jgi:chaperonin GroES
MGFRPLHDWVLIKRNKPEEKTSGGIIIPDAVRNKSTEGIVEAIGPGKFEQEKGKQEKKFVPTVLKPGQHVMFIDYMTKEIVLNGEEITIIQEDNILGIVESFGALAVKKQYHVEVKKDHPPMVQAEKTKAETKKTFEAEVTFKKAAKMGKAIKQVKAEVKTNKKKSATQGKDKKMKTTVKKAAPKKAAPAKKAVATKTVKKAVAKKAVPKKASPKKTVVKKVAAKKK